MGFMFESLPQGCFATDLHKLTQKIYSQLFCENPCESVAENKSGNVDLTKFWPMFLYKEESYQLVGLCMEVHRVLGRGLLEVLYKDALEHELKLNHIPFVREKQFEVRYKGVVLPHFFYADFVVFENIILEVKGVSAIVDEHIKQTLNYMAIAKTKVGYIVNFGGESLEYKRLIL